ncbi:MAG: hypothetical protein KDK26_14670 [Roseivivax sp.]|nr:hypothetical protein [Roseivivax sp.]
MSKTRISATSVRYIKLGAGGKFEQAALSDGRLYLGYHEVPHEDCIARDWESISRLYRNEGHKAFVASNHTRQVKEFYEEPDTCLWISFIDGSLWWTFAHPEVSMCIEDNWRDLPSEARSPSRFRSCLDQWNNTSVNGEPLVMRKLPGYVTKVVSGFRGTICQIEHSDAVIRVINGEVDPRVEEAVEARESLISSLEKVIDRLYWKDFETLIDLIFQRSGWPRVSRVGGSQKLVEFELENPVTGERSFAQVKAQTDQKTLDEYVERFSRDVGYKQMFFVCHTAKGKLGADSPDVFVWTGPKVAEMAVKTGLTDWVLEKVQ